MVTMAGWMKHQDLYPWLYMYVVGSTGYQHQLLVAGSNGGGASSPGRRVVTRYYLYQYRKAMQYTEGMQNSVYVMPL